MKTRQSIFPAKTKSKAFFRIDNTYKVMKKVQDKARNIQISQNIDKPKHIGRTQPNSPKIQNIFRDRNNTVKNYSLDQNIQRPIGGMELFRKVDKSNNLNTEQSTRRLSKKGSRKNIKQSRDRVMISQSRSQQYVVVPQDYKNQNQFKQETFKQHVDCKQLYTAHNGNNIYGFKSVSKYQSQKNTNRYSRKFSSSQQKYSKIDKKYSGRFQTKDNFHALTQSGISASVQSLSHGTQTQKVHLRWASEQQKNHLDKMAILNEINYNKPLIEKLGGKYFQCLLRNRYLDEPQSNNRSSFIYQIKEKLSDTKFISKIKSNFQFKKGMKPDFIQRNKMVVKGRNKMIKQQEGRTQVKDARKRWEGLNQESFQMQNL